jgi:hypothetical protein
MCNLYSLTKGQVAIIAPVRAMRDCTGNLEILVDEYSVRSAAVGRSRGLPPSDARPQRSTSFTAGPTKLGSKKSLQFLRK